MKRFCLALWLLLSFIDSQAQILQTERLGANFGLTFNIGSTVNRLGLAAGGYYLADFIQVNLHLRGFYSFSNLGPRPRIPGWEFQSSMGVVLGFGPQNQEVTPLLSPVSNQTSRQYAAAFAYNLYLDQMKTSQRTGTIAIHIGKFMAASENDALSGELVDKFRTASISFSYRIDSLVLGLNTTMWTGDSRDKQVVKVRESEYPGRFGYKDLRDAAYGRFSNGIQSFQVQYILPYGQVMQGNIGVDSEYVRHFWQNQLIHDMWFFPVKWNKSKNPHYPMLADDGLPYLYEEGQKVKPATFYWNIGGNPSLFY